MESTAVRISLTATNPELHFAVALVEIDVANDSDHRRWLPRNLLQVCIGPVDMVENPTSADKSRASD
jgi:hypothetical protein